MRPWKRAGYRPSNRCCRPEIAPLARDAHAIVWASVPERMGREFVRDGRKTMILATMSR